MTREEKIKNFLNDPFIKTTSFFKTLVSSREKVYGLSRSNLANKLSENHHLKFTEGDLDILEEEIIKFLNKYSKDFKLEKNG